MTPLMQQYWEIKSAHTDKVVLFRMGDFFEMFHADAELAAPILGIALTVRNKKANDETKMCGVPHHSVAGPIAKLLAAGHKVAICDQIEDPATAKGLVKRAVTRVLTPGMVYDPSTLESREGHFLSAFDESHVAFLEPTTGEAFYYKTSLAEERVRLWQLLQPKELVLTSGQRSKLDEFDLKLTPHLSVVADVSQDLALHGLAESCLRLSDYAATMQGSDIKKAIQPWQVRDLNEVMALSETSIRHLEIFNSYLGEKKGSLFFAIDRTKTAAGARLLRQWLQFPLIRREQIENRQEQVQFWIENSEGLKAVRDVLSTMGDVERRLGKIATPNCNARDLMALAQSLRAGLTVAPLCPQFEADKALLNLAQALAARMEKELVEEPPLAIRQGGIFKSGVTPVLDELIRLSEDGQRLLQELESREKQLTGIPTLKVRYNNVFGYYLEVTKTHTTKVPEHYRRKQTLANAERYTTEELGQLEDKLLSSHSKRSELEWEMFNELRAEILTASADLLHLARQWAELDVLTGLAWLAVEQEYVRPQFTDQVMKLEASRHPVVEQAMSRAFVPNSLDLHFGHCLLLTGPNMAGKSTIMRQMAVTALLAQVGSFVPASSASLPIFDRIFTRIGASDLLAEGLSTFMVEMKEAGEILKSAGPRSLVVLDEIGRGTSTYDGLSLAQAILEYLLSAKRPMVLFATHYHELTHMAVKFPQIKNAHMAIHERGGEIQFLHTLIQGPANKSYGIHVAKLAGLPNSVTARARNLLEQLEGGLSPSSDQLPLSLSSTETQSEFSALVDEIRQAPLQKMTPLEALNQIAQWQQSLS